MVTTIILAALALLAGDAIYTRAQAAPPRDRPIPTASIQPEAPIMAARSGSRSGSPAHRRGARGKRTYRRRQLRECLCGRKFEQRTTGEFKASFCPDCVAFTWRPVWSRDSGAPMPDSLRALVDRENARAAF